MIGRNTNIVALAVLAALAASPMASAQEAILLERIGAVHMATPDELQRAAAVQGRSVATDLPQAPQAHPGADRVGAAN